MWSAESLLESTTTATSPSSRSSQQARLPATPETMLQQHTRAVNSLAWHPTRPLLLSASQDGTTLLWESTSTMTPDGRSSSSTKTFPFFGKVETAEKQYRWNRRASFATKGDSILDVKWSPHHGDCTWNSFVSPVQAFPSPHYWLSTSIRWSHFQWVSPRLQQSVPCKSFDQNSGTRRQHYISRLAPHASKRCSHGRNE